jgi:hypothetical protein
MCHELQNSGASDAGPAPRPALPRVREGRFSPGVLLEGIQAALGDTTLGLSSFTPCVRLAIESQRTLTACGVPALVAVGRLHQAGRVREHAWTVRAQHRHWRTLDPHVSSSARHELLALLDGRGTWTNAPSHDLARLQPEFFLTMHCQINDAALKKLFDAPTIDDINHVNGRVDDPFAHPNYDPREHFDNSLIEESIILLEDRLSWQGDTRLHTVTTGAPSAIAYGLGCHAVADFYSHSNFAPMALAYYEKSADVLPIDQAIMDSGFLTFVEATWDNRGLWRDYPGYSTTQAFPLSAEFAKCLFTGAYSADSWAIRSNIPHHNDVAVDQPDSPLVHAPPILPRKHPFAFPGVWKQQYDLRKRLAIAHLRAVIQRVRDHDPTPFLGSNNALPDILKPPAWTLANNSLANAVEYLVRGVDGRPSAIA